MRILMFWMVQSAHEGALPQMRAATDPQVKGSDYYGPSGGSRGQPIKVKSNNASHNLEDAKRLWEISEELTGVAFSI